MLKYIHKIIKQKTKAKTIMEMELQPADIEPVTLSDVLGLATWNRPRTSEELQNFITTHHNQLPDDIEIQ